MHGFFAGCGGQLGIDPVNGSTQAVREDCLAERGTIRPRHAGLALLNYVAEVAKPPEGRVFGHALCDLRAHGLRGGSDSLGLLHAEFAGDELGQERVAQGAEGVGFAPTL